MNHPLTPLTPSEIAKTVEIVKKKKKNAHFVYVGLEEPSKQLINDWSPSEKVARQAFVVILNKGKTYELIVDIERALVVSYTHIPGVQAAITSSEYSNCEKVLKSHPHFIECLKRRGITDMTRVYVDLWTVGFLGEDDDPKRRLARPFCFYKVDDESNFYACPIEGVMPLIDLGKLEVVRIEDRGVVPFPPYDARMDYLQAWRNDPPQYEMKKLQVVQPDGPSFKVDGHKIDWLDWSFHVGFNPREGLVLYNIKFNDHGKVRPIIYRASLVEMIVPYAYPFPPHARKNAFDVGEEGLGYNSKTLRSGCDCVGSPYFFDVHMTTAEGALLEIEAAICVHEEDAGILWKHTDWRTSQTEVRRSRRLVVSFFTNVANYDYGFKWMFYQDGTIKVEADLTGILSTRVLREEETCIYGEDVAPRISGTNHQHFFCVRMDMQVDGDKNSVYEVNSVQQPRDPVNNPFLNVFLAKKTLLKKELDAQRVCDQLAGRHWVITNSHRKNAMGNPTAYALCPHENVLPFHWPDAPLMQRAPFLQKHLFVTAYSERERFPAGEYPNQNKKENAGLTTWTAVNRDITDTDIVLWYTFGVHHIPRPEDWPIMPVVHGGFTLKAFGFFDRNPSTNVPPSACSIPAKL